VSSSEASKTWLSQDAYDRLQAELDQMIADRPNIAAEINARREEGDLRENGGYHAAREEQSKNEGRIQELKHLLETAVIGAAPADDGVVEPGMVVEAKIAGDPETFLFGHREIADDKDSITVYSERSPLGEAIQGSKVGDTLSYAAPNGKDITVEIVSAKPYQA
jgi:transcription elongation factor GreA